MVKINELQTMRTLLREEEREEQKEEGHETPFDTQNAKEHKQT